MLFWNQDDKKFVQKSKKIEIKISSNLVSITLKSFYKFRTTLRLYAGGVFVACPPGAKSQLKNVNFNVTTKPALHTTERSKMCKAD